MPTMSIRWKTRWRLAIVAASGAIVAAVIADRAFVSYFSDAARERIRVAMAPYAAAITRAVDQRVALLSGLKSFADTRSTREALEDEFELFAQGSLVGTSGVLALQFVENGRIVRTWPIRGNEAALGYDLYSDPRPGQAEDVRRAMATGEITVTGPWALVQGGEGLLVRHRIAPRDGFPDLAAVVLSVPTIVVEAGITGSASDLVLEVRDRSLRWFGGDASGSAVEPETLSVSVPDGNWSLLGAPREGCSAEVGTTRRPFDRCSLRQTAARQWP